MYLYKGESMRKLILGASLIVVVAVSRFLPHPPNVVPLTAMALAGGVYLEKRFALLIPLLALFLSDVFLGFHATMPFVYGCFIATGLIGLWLQAHKKPFIILGGAIVSSVLFFAVTNFGVWLTGGGWNYPRTMNGLFECYVLAIPFFRNSLIGDIMYTAVLFGLFEIIEYTVRSTSKPQPMQ